jgi:hypothetical protein
VAGTAIAHLHPTVAPPTDQHACQQGGAMSSRAYRFGTSPVRG